MVSFTKTALTILPLVRGIQAWSISIQSEANCQDLEEWREVIEGDKGQSSEGSTDWCVTGVMPFDGGSASRTMQVKDWDDGCTIGLFHSGDCKERDSHLWKDPTAVYHKGKENQKDGKFCINNIDIDIDRAGKAATMLDVVYDCDGMLPESGT